ncbi:hypothetical protein HK104_005329, partial [Borealophlyctis nickersoniae]
MATDLNDLVQLVHTASAPYPYFFHSGFQEGTWILSVLEKGGSFFQIRLSKARQEERNLNAAALRTCKKAIETGEVSISHGSGHDSLQDLCWDKVVLDHTSTNSLKFDLKRVADATEQVHRLMFQLAADVVGRGGKIGASQADSEVQRLKDELLSAKQEIERLKAGSNTHAVAHFDPGFTGPKRMVPAKRAPLPKSLMNPRQRMKEAKGTEFGDERYPKLDLNPADLAQSGKKTEVRRIIQVPLVILQITLLAIILVLVVAPSSSIFIRNTRDTVDETAGVIVNITTSKTAENIRTALNNFKQLAQTFGDRSSVISVIENRNTNMLALTGTPWMKEYVDALNMFSQVASLTCLAAETPQAKANRMFPYSPNVTQIHLSTYGMGVFQDYYNFYPLDYTNNLTYSDYAVNPDGTRPPGGPGVQIFPHYNMSMIPAYQMLTSPQPETKGNGSWNLQFIASYNVLYMDYGTNFYNDPTTLGVPTMRCSAGSFVDQVMNPFLAASIPSNGSVVFVFDSRLGGSMIASSVFGSTMDIASMGTYRVDTAPNITVSQVGRYLKSLHSGDWTLMPPSSTHKATLQDGREWYIGTQQIRPDYINTWQVVVAIPREDFFGAIDTSIQKSVVIIAVLSCVGVVLIGGVSFLLTVPLKRVGNRMAEVTQMKFSALEQGRLNRRSIIKEIASLEDTFHLMVMAFASGIRKNADLVQGRRGQ